MKRFAIALLSLVATSAFAKPVELPVNVRDGATWTIETQRTRATDSDGKVSQVRTESRSRATYRTGSETGVLTLSPLPGSASADLPPELREFGFDFPLEFDVDEALQPLRMRNWPQLRAALLKFLEGQSPGDPRFADATRSVYGSLSDETAAGLFTPHLAFLGIAQGLAIELGKPVTYEDELPNPVGGKAIASKGSLLLESHDRRQRRAVVVWTQALDPASAAASVRESGAAIARQFGRAAAAADAKVYEQMKVERNDRCRFEIDTASGLAVRSECVSKVNLEAPGHWLRRTDTWITTQSLPESR